MYKGKKVAIKVQRAGLKELFDVDLKNLKKLAELLDRFDPKTDGADRDWVSIYEESERLLYLEIDYLMKRQIVKGLLATLPMLTGYEFQMYIEKFPLQEY